MATEIACNDLAELARYQASVRPEAVAIAFRGRETTYGQLDKRAGQVANGLRGISSVIEMPAPIPTWTPSRTTWCCSCIQAVRPDIQRVPKSPITTSLQLWQARKT